MNNSHDNIHNHDILNNNAHNKHFHHMYRNLHLENFVSDIWDHIYNKNYVYICDISVSEILSKLDIS